MPRTQQARRPADGAARSGRGLFPNSASGGRAPGGPGGRSLGRGGRAPRRDWLCYCDTGRREAATVFLRAVPNGCRRVALPLLLSPRRSFAPGEASTSEPTCSFRDAGWVPTGLEFPWELGNLENKLFSIWGGARGRPLRGKLSWSSCGTPRRGAEGREGR